MTRLPSLFLSNQVEVLFEHLVASLFPPGTDPFAKRLVVVPSPAMRSWLMLRLADEAGCHIAAGVEIVYFNQALSKVAGRVCSGWEPLPSRETLTFSLEMSIKARAARWAEMPSEEEAIWAPLFRYLKVDGRGFMSSRRAHSRLVTLCDQLASLFLEYGQYGGGMIARWEKGEGDGWQRALWQTLHARGVGWPYLYRQLTPARVKGEPLVNWSLHIFAMSFMSRLHMQFLGALAPLVPISHYMLSPCQAFWGDLSTDREILSLQEFWKRQEAPQAKQEALGQLLQSRHRFLANMGKVGREMGSILEEVPFTSYDTYVLPASISHIPQYDSLITSETHILGDQQQPLTLLQALQADMALLRIPESEEKIALPDDTSVQVHVVSTKLREVQVLYDVLMGLIAKHVDDADPITPSDIVVMATDIREYYPYIQMVFGQKDSQLDVQLYDLTLHDQSLLAKGFSQLLRLSEGRWDAPTLLQLFEHPCFRRKHQLTGEDLSQLRLWIDQLNICWGVDAHHRNELLNQDHCVGTMDTAFQAGTWELGLGRLLSGLAIASAGADVTLTQAQLLERWICLLRGLRDDLKPLSDQSEMTLSDWTIYLQCLLETYFEVDSQDSVEQSHAEQLKKVLNVYADAASYDKGYFQSAKFSFLSIKFQLDKALTKSSQAASDNLMQAVSFCSMLPMRAIPAKIIYIMGMEDGAYPRRNRTQPLNALRTDVQGTDYCPTSVDYDRYLFLEAILSARRYFHMSYIGYSQAEGGSCEPSLLVRELMSSLDATAVIGGVKPSEYCVVRHPFFPFDNQQTYLPAHYRAALAFYGQQREASHRFVPEFYAEYPQPPSNDLPSEIDIKLLTHIARDPIKAYFNHTLGIYLDDKGSWRAITDESFTLSNYDLAILRREALTTPIPEIVDRLKQEGKLPYGTFGEVAVQRLEDDVAKTKHALHSWGIHPHDIVDVELRRNTTSIAQVDANRWVAPSLVVRRSDGSPINIVGTLPQVTPKGLLFHGERSLESVVKCWPLYLLFHCLPSGLPIDVRQLLLTKKVASLPSPSRDLSQELGGYVDYALSLRQRTSPLMPEWVVFFLKKDPKGLSKAIHESLTGDFSFDKSYLKWTLGSESPDASFLVNTWSQEAQGLFGSMGEKWFPKKAGASA